MLSIMEHEKRMFSALCQVKQGARLPASHDFSLVLPATKAIGSSYGHSKGTDRSPFDQLCYSFRLPTHYSNQKDSAEEN